MAIFTAFHRGKSGRDANTNSAAKATNTNTVKTVSAATKSA